MTDDFVNAENAAYLQSLSDTEWEDFLSRWGRRGPEPVRFPDGTYYCDHGREVERKLFCFIHKDDRSLCRGSSES